MSNISAHSYTTFETAYGACAIAWNGDAITCFQLMTDNPKDIERWHKRRVPQAVLGAPTPIAAKAIDAATRYFNGEPVDFSDIPIDLHGQTDFFKSIYEALRRVPYGQTTTYGALAKELGFGNEAARDVGVAMSKNPVPLIIPCHRVLAAGGQLGGFSTPGGVSSKIRMLKLEGIPIPEPKTAKPKPNAIKQNSFDF